MSEDRSETKPATLTREERLAAKLRENLRRRKAQARAMTDSGESDTSPPKDEGEALPKAPRKS